jgi:hypothetical protein
VVLVRMLTPCALVVWGNEKRAGSGSDKETVVIRGTVVGRTRAEYEKPASSLAVR